MTIETLWRHLTQCISSSSGGVAIWMTSCLHTVSQKYRRRCSGWRHCVVVRRLTPLLRRSGRVVSRTMTGAEKKRLRRARGAEGEACNAPLTLPCLDRRLRRSRCRITRVWNNFRPITQQLCWSDSQRCLVARVLVEILRILHLKNKFH